MANPGLDSRLELIYSSQICWACLPGYLNTPQQQQGRVHRAEDSVPSTVPTWHSSLSSQPRLSPLLTTLRIHITVCACEMGKGVILPKSTWLVSDGLDPVDSSRSLFSFRTVRKYMLLDIGRHLEEALCISCLKGLRIQVIHATNWWASIALLRTRAALLSGKVFTLSFPD